MERRTFILGLVQSSLLAFSGCSAIPKLGGSGNSRERDTELSYVPRLDSMKPSGYTTINAAEHADSVHRILIVNQRDSRLPLTLEILRRTGGTVYTAETVMDPESYIVFQLAKIGEYTIQVSKQNSGSPIFVEVGKQWFDEQNSVTVIGYTKSGFRTDTGVHSELYDKINESYENSHDNDNISNRKDLFNEIYIDV